MILAANKVDLWQVRWGRRAAGDSGSLCSTREFFTVLPVSAIDGSRLVELVDTELSSSRRTHTIPMIGLQIIPSSLSWQSSSVKGAAFDQEDPHATTVIVDKVEAGRTGTWLMFGPLSMWSGAPRRGLLSGGAAPC